MKKFIAIVVLFLAVTASAFAAEYVVIKDGQKITIHKVTESNNTYISTYNLVNPTVSQLSDIGLPDYCWPWINGGDGAYDTRLVKAEQEINVMKANYENESEEVRYLEDQAGSHKVYITLLIIAGVIALLAIVGQATEIAKLKKKKANNY